MVHIYCIATNILRYRPFEQLTCSLPAVNTRERFYIQYITTLNREKEIQRLIALQSIINIVNKSADIAC